MNVKNKNKRNTAIFFSPKKLIAEEAYVIYFC